ncbi:MAG: hypothetical protein ACR2G0_02065 [Chthoniobacterales bacterium]
MKETRELGYAFALPRLIARLDGRSVCRAEFSRWEAYGLGILVFGISCVFVERLLWVFVRPIPWRLLLLSLLPFAMWFVFLLLYYVNALVIGGLRRLGLYRATTNNPFQHLVIMTLTTALALWFLREEASWVRCLGMFWLTLLALNLLALAILKFRHET